MRHPDIKGFFQAFGANWLTKMSGPMTVPFTILAFFVPHGKALLAGLAILCGVVSSYSVWAAEREKVSKLEEELKEKKDSLKQIEEQRPRILFKGLVVQNVSYMFSQTVSQGWDSRHLQ